MLPWFHHPDKNIIIGTLMYSLKYNLNLTRYIIMMTFNRFKILEGING